MKYDDLLELVKQRRSIRRFRPDPIPEEYVDKIIEVARWAPSGYNTQPWEFVVVRKQEFKSEIVRYIYEIQEQDTTDDAGDIFRGPMNWSTAPVFIILYGDIRTKVGLPMMAQVHDFEKIFNSSLASAFLNMHLAVTSLGLASQWVSLIGIPEIDASVKKLLEIREELRAYDMMALGYPAVKPRPKLIRARECMVHYDNCGLNAFRTDEEVADYARRTKTWATACHRRLPD
jgi:nitroreductase